MSYSPTKLPWQYNRRLRISSAQEGLTSVFGMGTGVAPPNAATQRYPWRDNWYTGGSSIQVLSYYGRLPSNLLRLPWIGTDKTVLTGSPYWTDCLRGQILLAERKPGEAISETGPRHNNENGANEPCAGRFRPPTRAAPRRPGKTFRRSGV